MGYFHILILMTYQPSDGKIKLR